MISFKRLTLVWKELWYSNSRTIFSIPLLISAAFIIYHFWPGGILYTDFLTNEVAEQPDKWFPFLLSYRMELKIAILILAVPIYLNACMRGYLAQLNTSIRVISTPIKASERLFAMALFYWFILALVYICYTTADHLFASLYKHLYLSSITQYLENTGQLYYDMSRIEIFQLSPFITGPLLILMLFLFIFLVPFHILSFYIFKTYKYGSYLFFIIGVPLYIQIMTRNSPSNRDGSINLQVEGALVSGINISLFLAILALLFVSIYYKLKEKEI